MVSHENQEIDSRILGLNPQKINTDPVIKETYRLLYYQLSRFIPIKKYIDASLTDVEKAKKMQQLLLFVNKLNETYYFLKSKNFKLETLDHQLDYLKKINESFNEFAVTVYQIPALNNAYNFTDKIIKVSQDFLSIYESLHKKDYSNAIAQMLSKWSSYTGSSTKENKLLFLVSQIAADKEGTQIKTLFKSYVDQLGTSTLKRSAPFNLSLNGYVGINGGYEWIRSGVADDNSYYAGITAPIGVSFSFFPSRSGSFSLFLELIDIGSLVNVRFKDDDTTYSDLRFEHFLSPGLGLFYNIKGIPLTLGARYNFISNLRQIEYQDGTSTITTTQRDVTRLNFSILVDIPLLTLVNKSR